MNGFVDIKLTNSLLLIIDLQVKLAPAISNFDSILESTLKLAKASEVLKVPSLITEQYVAGLGLTNAEVKHALPDTPSFHKTYFSACAEPGFLEALKISGKKQIIVAGTEAHVCVLQTCLELMQNGFEVIVASDAVGSRNPAHKKIALAQLKQAGGTISCAEIIIFKWTKKAATPTFKKILSIIK
ncbi:isochorismatase family protein [Pseudoalteromonas sp. MMG007]|uniref:isochorismatase family protein n=1 Tax=Pseudoalteromonas sp. MMG007 TaxID=2822684 RepID=UPI001B3679BF|nr:isochorismatase family protein [Pseudoalteromonas sp. MMG007]MBQ4857723.1 isochorismatase family protein [Pseudoalteromonas sp. MMG007]